MRAILVDAPGAPPRPITVPDPELPPHGALVDVGATGVCRSDWHAWRGHDRTVSFPHVPGHEFAGTVAAVGAEVTRFVGGERVTAPFCCGCGRCATCRSGHQNVCEREFQPGFDGWGSFAELVVVPWADVNLVELPDHLGFSEAAALGCRFTTAYGALVHQAALRAGETVVVYGCGGVGLSCVMVAAAVGARVVAVDVKPAALEAARSLGAAHLVDASRGDPVAAVLDLTGGADVSVDALGSPATCVQGIRSLRRRGRHLQLGLLMAEHATPRVPLETAIRLELRILGSRGMQAWRYAEMFSFIAERALPLERLVGDRRPLHEAGAVLESMGSFVPLGMTVLTP